MKTREEVERRLRKLRVRYAHKFVQRSQERLPHNCVHNQEHLPRPLPKSPVPLEQEMAPRRQVTLVVIGPDRPVRLCTHKDIGPLSLCDSEDVSRRCPKFSPAVSLSQARHEFLQSLAGDEYVFDNYRDVATLQWVLGERVHDAHLSWWHRVWLAVMAVFSRVARPSAPVALPETPKDLWDDSDAPPPAA